MEITNHFLRGVRGPPGLLPVAAPEVGDQDGADRLPADAVGGVVDQQHVVDVPPDEHTQGTVQGGGVETNAPNIAPRTLLNWEIGENREIAGGELQGRNFFLSLFSRLVIRNKTICWVCDSWNGTSFGVSRTPLLRGKGGYGKMVTTLL